jgi:iron-sulfur cluster repair protein YtfE (RIC family)
MSAEILKHDHNKLAKLFEKLKASLQNCGVEEFQVLDLFWAQLAVHIRAEQLCLFPAILSADRKLFGVEGVPSFEDAELAIAQLKSDHNFFMDQLAEAVKTFRGILAQSLPACESAKRLDSISERINLVASQLESHNLMEELQVYVWPQLILNPKELDGLNAALKRELENLPARFNDTH